MSAVADYPVQNSSWWTTSRLRLVLGFILGLIIIVGVLTYVFTRPGSRFDMNFIGIANIVVAPGVATSVPVQASSCTPSACYIYDDLGFYFGRPTTPGWSAPMGFTPAALFRAQGISPKTTSKLGLTSVPFQAERLTSGSPVPIRWLPRSTFDVAGTPVPIQSVLSGLGSTGLSFTNGFAVETVDKSELRGAKLTLAGLFVRSMFNLQLWPELDSIQTRNDMIVATATLHYGDVLVGGRQENFEIDHGFLFAESATRFYVVEILFSPQTHDPTTREKDLQSMLSTFRLTGT